MNIICFIDLNECASKPCGKHARCTDTVGSYVCTCEEDYTGDPYKGCEGNVISIY